MKTTAEGTPLNEISGMTSKTKVPKQHAKDLVAKAKLQDHCANTKTFRHLKTTNAVNVHGQDENANTASGSPSKTTVIEISQMESSLPIQADKDEILEYLLYEEPSMRKHRQEYLQEVNHSVEEVEKKLRHNILRSKLKKQRRNYLTKAQDAIDRAG